MMIEVARNRPYRSSLRAEQAAATRQRILLAARSLLLARGFAATRLEQVATEAGVALPTLTGYFPNKAALLDAVLRSVVRGGEGDGRGPIGEQLAALLDIPDSHELLAAVAAVCRAANERGFELFEILRKAAAAEPKLERQRQDAAEARRRDQVRIARHLKRKAALRAGLTEQEATDLLWFYSSADTYRLLVNDSHWSPAQYERWLARTLADTLLHPVTAGAAGARP